MNFRLAITYTYSFEFRSAFQPLYRTVFPNFTFTRQTIEFDLDSVKMNRNAKYVGQRSFCPKVVVQTHTHTHAQAGPIAPPGPLVLITLVHCSAKGGATGKTLDLRSVGRGFRSYSGQRCVTTLGKLFTPMFLYVIKQYNLLPAKGRWCCAAGKVTAGLA